ncbi:MAG: acyl carrier protein [Chloroflexi bacterium]|nr:acyl carrier protein [Chloroflexota bacterium]
MDIRNEVRQYIKTNFLANDPGVALEDKTALITGGIVDSIGMIGLIAFIETQFGVEFMPRDVDARSFDTVERIESLILNKLAPANTVVGQDQGEGNAV